MNAATITVFIIPMATLVWYFARGKKTSDVVLFVMAAYVLTFIAALVSGAVHG